MKTVRTGVPSGRHQLNPELMPWKEIGSLNEDELRAFWLYLQSLPNLAQVTE